MDAIEFADATERLWNACRAAGLQAPSFIVRPGPRMLRRFEDDKATIVFLPSTHGRTASEVYGDMVDGAMAANDNTDQQVRAALCAALLDHEGEDHA